MPMTKSRDIQTRAFCLLLSKKDVLLLLALSCSPAGAGTLTTLHQFTGGPDGAQPYKGMVSDGKGNFYGETFYGADACPDSYLYANVGCGTVYHLDATNTLTTLLTFSGSANGAGGDGNLTLRRGRLYGTAYTGGAANQGLLFSIGTTGQGFKVLHDFAGTDGGHPNTYPRFDANGNIFSEAPYGGPGYTGTDFTGYGLIYEVTAGGQFIAQHYFSGGADGGVPGRIFLDAAGTIYGATATGGTCTGSGLPSGGCGVIYSFVPSTAVFTTLYTMNGTTDGYQPQLAGVDKHGNLFGIASQGGASKYGTLFELKSAAGGYSFKLLHSFTGGADGGQPTGAPALTASDELVGTTLFGPGTGANAGVLFTYAKGAFTTLHAFSNAGDGGFPQGTPGIDRNGVITGTTGFGGTAPCKTSSGTLISSYGCGVIFSYTP